MPSPVFSSHQDIVLTQLDSICQGWILAKLCCIILWWLVIILWSGSGKKQLQYWNHLQMEIPDKLSRNIYFLVILFCRAEAEYDISFGSVCHVNNTDESNTFSFFSKQLVLPFSAYLLRSLIQLHVVCQSFERISGLHRHGEMSTH